MPGLISIADLVRGGTLSAEVAAALWAAMDQSLSFVVVAVPSFAGKTTLMNAVLALRPPSVPAHLVSGEEGEMAALEGRGNGGYLVVEEISLAPVPTYIWGAPVRRVFKMLRAGYSLAATLHAQDLEEVFESICGDNGVSDEDASCLKLVLCLERFGYSPRTFRRRLVEVHEVDQVAKGRPQGRLLYRWMEKRDAFEAVAAPRQLKASNAELAARAALVEELAKTGRTSPADVARMLAAYRARR